MEKAYRRGLQKAWRPQVQVEFFEADDDRSDCDDAGNGTYVSNSYVNSIVDKRTAPGYLSQEAVLILQNILTVLFLVALNFSMHQE